MKSYYVYQLIDPRTNKSFYIGKGSGNRALSHFKFKDGNGNTFKDNIVSEILAENLMPKIEYIHININNEKLAYDLEEHEIIKVGIENLTNIVPNARPPSRLGWKPSKETLEKRSKKLKGITRTSEWKLNLSKSKKGIKNPRYGMKAPCTEERRLAVIKGKNITNYSQYKKAIGLMNSGISADKVAIELGIGRGVCFKLKNRSHLFFKVFPELI